MQSQEGRAHGSGSLSGDMSGDMSGDISNGESSHPRVLEVMVKAVAIPQLLEVLS